jgi:LmbE family N-acetylglucosaminyl deacetylase
MSIRYVPFATIAAAAIAIVAVSARLPAQLRVAPVGERPDSQSLDLLLRKLASTGTFMQTDAHPDDEDNGLLAMLGYGQGMRVALVTATRGDGGQNEIGPELGQALGVLRTEELLAVHRFDGAEQYFTRAIDFGYSFSIDESVQKWGETDSVGDYVRQIRTVRPDVIAGFLCGGTSGGLHHQASAKLTLEAFRAAGDPARYPEQIREGLRPWQPARYFCTDETSFGPPQPLTPDKARPDLLVFDSVLGRSYAELGLEARSMHKCQGTSQLLLLPGAGQSRTYKLQGAAAAATGVRVGAIGESQAMVAGASLFDGIDTSVVGLIRFAGQRPEPSLRTALVALQQQVVDARAAFASRGVGATVAPLVAGLRATRALRADLPRLLGIAAPEGQGGIAGSEAASDVTPAPSTIAAEIEFRLAQKERQFQDALVAATGIRLDALADDGAVTQGQTVNVTLAGASAVDGVELVSAKLAGFDGDPQLSCTGTLGRGAALACKAAAMVPAAAHLSTPYWTPRTDAARYDFEPDVPFGAPFRPSPFRATFELRIGGVSVSVGRVIQYRYSNLVAGEKRSELNVSPAFNVRVDPAVAVVPIGSVPSPKTLTITVGNNQKKPTEATVVLNAPTGWTITPASAPISFQREDEEVSVAFTVDPPPSLTPGEWTIGATVTAASGASSTLGYQVVEYPHTHRRHVVEPAAARVKAIEVAIAPNLKIGYVMGVGDRVPDAIAQLGADVQTLDATTLASGDLSRFNAIVLGVRAYERRQDLRANNRRLLDYAHNGGTVIVQYQRTEFNDAQYGPYPAKTTSERVTDETAPMEILEPDHPVFNTPNRIGPETWTNWVQERGTYFLGERDSRYVDLLRSADPFPYNAGPKTGILVEARVGQGRWLYTGLGLWRQLPAGVDGAYRLLANLLSLGKQ